MPSGIHSDFAGDVHDWGNLDWEVRSALWSKLAGRLTLEGQETGRMQQITEAMSDGVQEVLAIPIAEQKVTRWQTCIDPLNASTSLGQLQAHTSTLALQPDGQVSTEDPDLSVMGQIRRRLMVNSFWRFIDRHTNNRPETLEEKRKRVMSGPIKKVLKTVRWCSGLAGWIWDGGRVLKARRLVVGGILAVEDGWVIIKTVISGHALGTAHTVPKVGHL